MRVPALSHARHFDLWEDDRGEWSESWSNRSIQKKARAGRYQRIRKVRSVGTRNFPSWTCL